MEQGPFKVTYPLCQVVQSSISQCGGFKIRDLSCNLGAYMNERILKKILISFNRWQLQIMHISEMKSECVIVTDINVRVWFLKKSFWIPGNSWAEM